MMIIGIIFVAGIVWMIYELYRAPWDPPRDGHSGKI